MCPCLCQWTPGLPLLWGLLGISFHFQTGCFDLFQGKKLPYHLGDDAEEGEVSDEDSADEIEDECKFKLHYVSCRLRPLFALHVPQKEWGPKSVLCWTLHKYGVCSSVKGSSFKMTLCAGTQQCGERVSEWRNLCLRTERCLSGEPFCLRVSIL